MTTGTASSRLAAALLLIFLLLLVAAAVIVPMHWLHQRYDNTIEDFSDRLRRSERIAASRPLIEPVLAKVEQVDSHRYMLQGESLSLTAAELQTILARIVESNGGRMISSQIPQTQAASKSGELTRLAVTMQIGASAVPLQLVLHAIESNEPYLFIDQMTVRASQGRNAKSVPGVQPEFNIQLTVSGFAGDGK